jgi:transposase
MARFDLSDEEWAIIGPLLPNKPRGVPRTDDRRVLNGIFHILRTGAPWRDLPERYGPYTTCYNRFNRWAKAGVWLKVFEALAQRSPQSMHRSTARSFALTSTRQAVKKGRGSRHWPFAWRTEHQDQCAGGRMRIATSDRAERRPGT